MSTREDFEAWAGSVGYPLTKTVLNSCGFAYGETASAWKVWQAATSRQDAKIKALAKQEQPEMPIHEAIYKTIINWDEGGGKRSRRELTRRIEALYAAPPTQPALTYADLETCREVAGKTFRYHKSSVKGQQLCDADDYEWHLAKAIEAYCRGGNHDRC